VVRDTGQRQRNVEARKAFVIGQLERLTKPEVWSADKWPLIGWLTAFMTAD
jgi:hypothetical protein